jgi:hypothetical protein
MKKIISMMILLACIFTFSRCSDEAYNEKYVDPNKVTTLLMEKVMTGLFQKINDWAIMGYGRYYSLDNMYLSNFTQSFGRPFSNTMYHNGWSDDGSGKYVSFFAATGLFKKLEMMYNDLAEAEKPAYEAYYLASKIHLYAFMLTILDIYGDIPYTEGGMVAATGDLAYSNPHFDHAEDLYKLIIDEMKTAGLRFASVSRPKDFTAASDFVNDADFSKWQKYANSLRLRVAMRVAGNGPLAELGKAAVKEILENPATYPIVEDIDDNIQIENRRGVGWTEGNGLEDGDGSGNRASDDLVSRMLSNYDRTTWSGTYQDGIDDPRIAILYDLAVKAPGLQTGYPSYVVKGSKGQDSTITQSGVAEPTVFRGATYEMSEATADSYSNNAKGFSLVRYNGFMWRNTNWAHLIISASELWFIKAEAFHYGWANGDAKAAFKEGVKQSFKLYFKYHKTKSQADDSKGEDGKSRRGWVINPTEPSDAWIDAFAEARWNAPVNSLHPYTDKVDAIITQKYIDNSILNVRETWCDLRRTGYPSGIYFPTVSDATVPNLPVRLRYPSTERDFNKNFPEVNRSGFNADDYYTKLFWAK